MEQIYFTLTGTRHYYGKDFFTPGMEVRLVKEPENVYDREAIRVELEGLGKVGYVANSPCTVQGESISAGRLYDKIGGTALGTVRYVLPNGVLCTVHETSLPRRETPERAERRRGVFSHARRSISFKKSSNR